MSHLFWALISYLLKGMISLRYRIEVRGMEKLTPERLNKKDGILFMPNHPAHMDPLFNFVWLWPKFRMRPLVIEHIFVLPFLKPLNRLVRSICIPNFEMGVNEFKVKKAEKAVREIAEGLKTKGSFLVYPSGKLKPQPKELLGGASGAHELLKECPDANVVLIRTTGLWGSSFSRAITGASPPLGKMVLHGFLTVLKNALFFTPRRKVLIELEPNPEDFPKGDFSRIELNRYLENWYNRYPDEQGNIQENEPLKLVSYSFWHKDLPEVHKPKKKRNVGNGDGASEETKRKIYQEIRRILDRPDLEIKPEQSLAFDLGMDSLNVAEFIAYLTKNFDIKELHPEELETIGNILDLAESGKEGRTQLRAPSPFTWPNEPSRPLPALPMGRTIAEAFLNCCERMNGYACCGDDLSGVFSYRKMKKVALVLAQYFLTWEETHVAVLLPASAGAYIVILALELAGKVPVMLNWTLGPRYLEEMMKISGAKGIITSLRFLDRLPGVQFGAVLEKLVMLEDIRKSLTLKMKLKGVYLSKCSVKHVVRHLRLDQVDENSPCVILFTSGTEAAPKGVPLSHKNIIANQRSGMLCIDLYPSDVIYAILPPFHSFGFSVAGLFPLLGGVKLAFYPDPTDSFALAEGVSRWKVTLFCGAPAFIKGLLRAGKKEQLKSIRFFVSGAEKAPEELFQKIKELGNGQLVEGYGITECSPIITINRPHLPPKGVGRLLPDVELITIHPETLEVQPPGGDGEICVRGPNVFSGYLGQPRTPFIEIEGKKWYRTGDLGHLEPDGSLVLSGRLKRFTKLGGEMISLGGVEEVIVKSLIQKGKINPDIPSVAVCALEKETGKSQLILFSIIDLDKEEANQILQQGGFSNLVKISEVKRIEEIPLMGAGKTDYRKLQEQCN